MTKEGIILVIDIDDSSARTSKDTLQQLCSNEVIIAETITKAQNMLDENHVVFSIINFSYNNDESMDFIKKIRKDTRGLNYKMPLLALIEKNSKTNEQHVLNAGASKCILKPFSTSQLKDEILDIISNPKNFIISDNYIGPDRRIKSIETKHEKRKTR